MDFSIDSTVQAANGRRLDSRLDSLRQSLPTGSTERSSESSAFRGLVDEHLSSSEVSAPVDIQKEIAADPEKKRLYDAAVEFQSIFVNMMLKSMRSSLHKEQDLLYGGRTQEIFEDMLYDEYAKLMSRQGGFNLSDDLYKQIAPFVGPAAAEYNRNGLSTEQIQSPMEWSR